MTVPLSAPLHTPAAFGNVRVASIDVFRGITMAVMIFVNALAAIHGLPWWNYHAPGAMDAMTYPDFVFPFFLFAIGLSLPLAIEQRLSRNASLLHLWRHIVERFASLLALGLFLANAEKCNAALTHMPGNLWALAGLLSMALYLHAPPRSENLLRTSRILRWSGLGMAVLLLALFRRTAEDGSTAWLDSSYPEILGLIAFSYLGSCLFYVPLRRFRIAPLLMSIAMTLFCVACAAHWVHIHLSLWFWPFSNGSMCALIFAGATVSRLFTGPCKTNRAVPAALALAGAVLLAAWMLAPLGISKIRATPTWTLASMGAATLLFLLLYWICDRRQRTGWAAPIHAAGANTLLTYLLPDVWYFLLATTGITFYDVHAANGLAGVAKSIVFTLGMLGIAALLTRVRVRLQL